ncbi:hypothetical protein LJ707_09910 [Mucilaginibacter sp. UR6-1]|uniref:hypothetical protein n=1 Tax=Mucilaginibacter sp. UR6-1 TaxID=1435643 RepID=UPI001E2F6D24|nr:hypothetical protein [Mucilaginibacter sp. UR6-1]MCC8409248.1 hypothetical protein [Mucilaginibacter sp. UR6-1]
MLTAGLANAQTFGGNPPSLKWQQVNTEAARVIFPAGMDSTGTRVAVLINRINNVVKPTIGVKQKQVNIVLQNQTTESNGYVGLAPFRSEFYLTPQQNSFELGSIPWPEMLAVHEFRHVQQYNNFNVGLSHVLKIFFGEGGQAFGNALSVPNWFFEGDAVYNETLVSAQGRGRLPYFYNGFRGLWAAGKDYNWMKLRNGSYIDYVPNHYPLGYMMVAYGREKYGDDFWRNVTHDAAAYKSLFYPFQSSVKKHSGISFGAFRTAASDHFRQQFNDAAPQKQVKHFIADEEFPAFVNDSTIIYLKSPYNQIASFVIRTGGKEKKITTRAISQDRYFDYNNGKIVYSAYRRDLRWGYRNYHEIRVVDVSNGHERTITGKTKYFSPAFSADGKRIVAVQANPDGSATLHVLNAQTGKLITAIANPDRLFYTYPKFYGDDVLSAVRNNRGEMAIIRVNTVTGKQENLLPFSHQPAGYLTIKQDTVYFTATSGINDDLFALSVNDKKLFKLKTGTKTIGYYQPTVSAGKLAWVGFTASGYQIMQTNKQDVNWEAVATGKLPGGLPQYNVASLNKNAASGLIERVEDTVYNYPVAKYSKGYNLFNFHSLIPEISDPDYRLSIVGQNVLNTFESELYFNYNRNEGYKQAGFDLTYGQLFPYLSAGADYIYERRRIYRGSDVYWNEFNIHGGVQLPFNFTRGKNITGLSVGSDLYYAQTNYQDGFEAFNRHFTYLNSYLSFSTRVQQARQHINPRWGQSLLFIYKNGLSLSANQYLASGTFYLPGLWPNHSLVINAAHQQHGQNNAVSFSNNFPFSKGYSVENLYKMDKLGANYHFPIAYPDAGLANTVYLMRIRGNAFYEYTRASDFYTTGNVFKANFRSVGGAVFFDTKFFNETAISFGVRYSRLLDPDIFGGTGRDRFEIVLPVSIF